MCFLKRFVKAAANLSSNDSSYEQTHSFSSDDSFLSKNKKNTIFTQENLQNLNFKRQNTNLLNDLLNKLNYNSFLINSLENKINDQSQLLNDVDFTMIKADQKENKLTLNSIQTESSLQNVQTSISSQLLTNKLFGQKSYKYKLRLTKTVPQTVYKERNIAFAVELINLQGHLVRNSNIIHLCMGVCDSQGEWIPETRAGDNFMKGKTETELYHGEANYSKIYPRDVSRNYEGGKVNFVVYTKPSMLHYTTNNSLLESKIDDQDIEPLLIKDLTIRAKKKE